MNGCYNVNQNTRRAFAIGDIMGSLIAAFVVLGTVVPVISGVRSQSGLEQSMSNLRALGAAHVSYAADNGGRQFSVTPQGLAAYGDDAPSAVSNCQNSPDCSAPNIWIGMNETLGIWYFGPSFAATFGLYEPLRFSGISAGFGYFRLDNVYAFHSYVGNKFHARAFYAPDDEHVFQTVQAALDSPASYHTWPAGGGNTIYWSSYARSPAALFDPQVMRAPSQGGWIDPWSIDTGLDAPPLNAAKYPDLKTHVIEHHWIQNRPKEPCNPWFGDQGSYYGCEPWYFNHGIESAPATLFYDGHVRLLPNAEAQASDLAVLKGSEGVDGLWSRDTPFGANGYFLQYAHDSVVDVSHHILTTNGILGRDTLGPETARSTFEAIRRDREAGPSTLARPSIFEGVIKVTRNGGD